MEFVQYEEVLPALGEQGLVEAADGDDLIRLEMEPTPGVMAVHVKGPDSRTPPFPDAEVLERPTEQLSEAIRRLLDKMHLAEVLVIPVASWREVIDCVAYGLAEDEEWREMDAVAAVHQNTRNPLAVTRAETRVLIDMIRELYANGCSARQEFVVVSDVTPLLIEVFHDGAFCVSCNEKMSEIVHKALGCATG